MSHEEIRQQLQDMQDDEQMITKSAYSPTAIDLPGNKLPFVDLHLMYLKNHKNINPSHYLSNLKIMLKVR